MFTHLFLHGITWHTLCLFLFWFLASHWFFFLNQNKYKKSSVCLVYRLHCDRYGQPADIVWFNGEKQLSTVPLEWVQVIPRDTNPISQTSSIKIYSFCAVLKLVGSFAWLSIVLVCLCLFYTNIITHHMFMNDSASFVNHFLSLLKVLRFLLEL